MSMLEAGDLIAGRYRLESLIGEGGMASVWRAEDLTLRRAVAIKLLYLRGHRDPTVIIDQFLREARIAASVQHRNVIHTVDFGVADGLPYMVMELLTGESLHDRMQREPALRMEEVVHFASLTLRGLAAVHAAGIVHRDLKPQNIFLHRDTDTVYPKILDFGISRSLGGDHERPSAISTQDGMIVGTPDYMSPEQARGEKDIDKRADIYSMGALIYEGITGRLPYQADTVGELIVQIVTTTPKPMVELRPDVPRVLSDCVGQAMAHDREERFIDAQVFRRALITAAERAFPVGGRGETSDRPGRPLANAPVALPLPLPPQSPPQSPPGSPPPLAAVAVLPAPAAEPAARAEWGDFEGLAQQAGRNSLVGTGLTVEPPLVLPPVQDSASAALGLPAASGPARVPNAPRAGDAGAPAPLAAGRPPAAAQKDAKREAGGRVAPKAGPAAPEDSSLLGHAPFDGLGVGPSAMLDLDYGHDPAGARARAGQAAVNPSALKTPVQARIAGGTARAPRAKVAAAGVPVRRASTRRRSSLMWLAPLLVLLGLGVLLVAPELFSAPAPDSAAAVQLEGRNPATAGSDRLMQLLRRRNVGARPPALRDVGF